MQLVRHCYRITRVVKGSTFTLQAATMSFKYPVARRDESVQDDYFGVKVADPYRWLEDPDSEETKAFVEAQNAITRPYIEECKYKDIIKEKITNLWNFPKVSTPFRHGSYYFQYRNSGLQNQGVIYIQNELGSEGSIFLDPNALSEDGTIALSGHAFSEDGKTFAYGLSASGSDWIDIKFKDVATGNDYKEVLKKVKYSSMTWMHDNKGFFYGGYHHQTNGKADGSETTASENQKLYYHKLGTDQSEDKAVVEFEDSQIRIGAAVSDCGKYLVVTPVKKCKNNLLYFGNLDDFSPSKGKMKLQPVVTELKADYEYITNNGNLFFIKTNQDAPNYKIIIIDLDHPEESNWRTFIPEHPKDVLDYAKAINKNMLAITYLHDVKDVLQLYDLETGKKLHDFKLDVGTITSISGKREHTQMFYSFGSFLTPSIIYQVDFNGQKFTQKVFYETKVGDFDASKYETKQVFYKSKDGVDIPMFLVNKKGFKQDGTKPCLLYGYGGFKVNLTPNFGISRLIFINQFDGIFALANIRGGGEYGDKWHNAARFEKKQNSFDDFQYAAKYLVKEKYTCVDKLTIQGGSNGGLLVAACINQAPELFGAAICQVGVLDMLRYHKFTIGYAWTSDYGCADKEDEFKYLIKYSPLHNIFVPTEKKQYPATLFLTADHDDRVVPLHSFKFVAELHHKIKNVPAQTNPLLIRIETKAGHGGGKPTTKIIEEMTDIFCFLCRALNLPFYK